ncbi:MAG: lactate racemase domain-containing protein [Dehalococcoidia bacterium]|nr:lactate racemase domain-containing protein [Dehalococcoidia bacterium]
MILSVLTAGKLLVTLDVTDTAGLENQDSAISEAIENPIGLDKNILEIANPGETLAIVVPDSLRTTRIELTVYLMPSAGYAVPFFE